MLTRTSLSPPARWPLISAALKIAASVLLLFGVARANDMATVEQRIITELMSSLPSDSWITSRISQLGTNGLWSSLTYADGTNSRPHLFYMRDMAEAYNNPASIHYLSTILLEKYMLAFDGWVTADPSDPNWWWNEIAFPKALGEAMILMESSFTSARLTSGATLIARSYRPRSDINAQNTGANRTDRSYATMLRALITNNSSLLSESFLSIGDAIEYTTLEGMQPDGSYHQHGAQLYVGGYGVVFVNGVSQYANYGVGTQYTYSPRQIREFTDFLLDGAQWFTRGPVLDYPALGRGITAAAPQRASGFINSFNDTVPLAGTYRAAELASALVRLRADRDSGAANPATALIGNRSFWRSDYMAHHRPGFLASVKTASTRTVESELVNEEGKKSLHMSDGMMLIHRRGDEYNGITPVWDWQRLPGTTIEQATYSLRPVGTVNNWAYGTSTHAGSVSDGTDGALAYIYSKRNVSARKSWFFVGDSVVALGSAVNATASTSPVLTSLNQSLLKTPITYSTGGAPQTLTTGTVTPAGLQWVNHDDTGYFFFAPQNAATVRAQPQSGTQFDVDGGIESPATTALLTANVFSLDVNHGTAFSGGSYAYVVAPGLTAAAMPSYPLSDLTVLSNTSNIQAVKSVSRGLTLANFFAADTVDGITVSHSCSILVRELNGVLEVTVSDPKQTITGDLTIQIARSAAGLIEADGPVTVDQLTPTLTLRFNMASSTGRSFKAKFFTTPGAYTTVTLNPTADADVLDGSGGTNFGSATTLRTKFDSSTGDWSESYLKFNLLGLPNTLAAARLVLNPTALSTTPTLHSVAPLTTHTWTEGGLTWNNRPQPNGPPTTLWLPRASQAVRADVRPLLSNFVNTDGNFSLWVAPRMQTAALVSFASRNHATTNLRPKLELTFASAFGVDNSIGAATSVGTAQLRGWLVGAAADVSIYWGLNDGGTTAENWSNVISLPGSVGGTISSTITNLVAGSTYYYRLYGAGISGSAWAPQTASFISPSTTTVLLGNLSQTYDGTARSVTATTTPTAGISVAVTYAGSATAPTAAGSYAIVATVTDPAYVGSATGTLIVEKATPTITTPPTATGILAGEPLSASVLSGGTATALGAPASGSFVFAAPSTVPAAGNYSAAVNFVPTDTANFNTATGGQTSVTVAANQPPVVSPGSNQGAIISGTNWTPASISKLAWYDAADATTITTVSGAVSQWNDKSGSNRHATQTTVGNRPTYRATDPLLNSRPSIGTSVLTGKIGLNTPSLTAKTVYVVSYYNTGSDTTFTGYPTLFSGPGTNGLYRVMGNNATADYFGTSQFNDAGTFKNGATTSSVTALPMAASVFKFKSSVARTQVFSLGYNAATVDRNWQGAHSEWLFTDGTETTDTEQRIEGYLAHKWGLGGSLPADHPYKQPTSISAIAVVTLDGSATDPENRTLTYLWSVVSGPGTVNFANPSAAQTTATFTQAGVYTLRLTASDGAVTGFNDLSVTVGTAATNYTVTFDANGGTTPTPATIEATFAGTYGTLPTTSRSSYSFTGWFTAPTGGSLITAGSSVAINSDHTLYARWNGPPLVNAGSDQLIPLDQWRPWTPAEITTAAWYDAADAATLTASSGAVAQWADKSGNANHLAQATSGARPATGTRSIGGRNVVAFNANNDNFMDALHSASLNFDASGGLNTFIVFQSPGYNDQTGGMNAVFGKGSPYTTAASPGFGLNYSSSFNHTHKFADGDSRSLTLGTSYLNTPLLFSTTANHTTGAQGFYLNGGSLSVTRTATPPRSSDNIGNFRVGGIAPGYTGGPGYATNTRYADVDVGELLLVPGALTLADRQRLEGYLAHKWSLAANLPAAHPHKTQAPGSFVAIANLNGTATDNQGDPLTHLWSVVSGPAAVTFGNASALSTTATLPADGSYTLRLTSTDGLNSAYDDLVITVGNAPPLSAFETWADGASLTFAGDSNGDGVADGLAWLLGAEVSSANASGLQPVAHHNNGAFSVSFRYLVAAKRGSSTLRLQHSATLAPDSWADVAIPDESGTVDGVEFLLTPVPASDLNQIQATLPPSDTGRVFIRLAGELPGS